jgi:ABC-type glycerol-3-phosphate transport system substrate-binding protein
MKLNKIDIFIFSVSVLVLVLCLVFYPGKIIEKPPVTITFLQWWENDMADGALDALVRDFDTEHPGIKIKLDTKQYSQIYADLANYKMPEAQTQRSDFDVAAFNPVWFAELRDRALFLRYKDAPQTELAASASSAAALDEYGAFITSFMNVFIYNIDMLRDTGFDRPPQTRSDVAALLREIKNLSSDKGGIAFSKALVSSVFPWLVAGMQSPPDADSFDAFVMQETPAVNSCAQFINELRDSALLGLRPFMEEQETIVKDFADGKIAMFTGDSSVIQKLRGIKNGLNFGISAVPVPENYLGGCNVSLSAWYAGVSAQTKHKEEAILFLQYLTENKAKIANAAGAVPGDMENNSVDDESFADAAALYDDEAYSKAKDIYEFAAAVKDWSLPGLEEQLLNVLQR